MGEIILPFPPRSTVKHENLHLEMVEKTTNIVVHIFPTDPTPSRITEIIEACKQILPKKFRKVRGKVEAIRPEDGVVAGREVLRLPQSVCITIPKGDLRTWGYMPQARQYLSQLDGLATDLARLVN